MTTHASSLATDAILTPAETRITIGYVEGFIGKEIADRNNISYNTVVRNTQNIYEKTGIRRTTNSLVAWFLSTNFSLKTAGGGLAMRTLTASVIPAARSSSTATTAA